MDSFDSKNTTKEKFLGGVCIFSAEKAERSVNFLFYRNSVFASSR